MARLLIVDDDRDFAYAASTVLSDDIISNLFD